MTPGAVLAGKRSTLRGRASAQTSVLAREEPRIGPNAVLQTLRAAVELEGPDLATAVAARAELPTAWPEGLIPEAWFVRTADALRAELGGAGASPERAEAILAAAGRRTGDYVAAHRIPVPFRVLLRLLPIRVAVPTLLWAFARHAWTFAGRSAFAVEGRAPRVLVLDDAPTCRTPLEDRRGGHYYEAAFERLLSLCGPGLEVREVTCRARGDAACRFHIELTSSATEGR